jgi:hypothetical protein
VVAAGEVDGRSEATVVNSRVRVQMSIAYFRGHDDALDFIIQCVDKSMEHIYIKQHVKLLIADWNPNCDGKERDRIIVRYLQGWVAGLQEFTLRTGISNTIFGI